MSYLILIIFWKSKPTPTWLPQNKELYTNTIRSWVLLSEMTVLVNDIVHPLIPLLEKLHTGEDSIVLIILPMKFLSWFSSVNNSNKTTYDSFTSLCKKEGLKRLVEFMVIGPMKAGLAGVHGFCIPLKNLSHLHTGSGSLWTGSQDSVHWRPDYIYWKKYRTCATQLLSCCHWRANCSMPW